MTALLRFLLTTKITLVSSERNGSEWDLPSQQMPVGGTAAKMVAHGQASEPKQEDYSRGPTKRNKLEQIIKKIISAEKFVLTERIKSIVNSWSVSIIVRNPA